MLGRDPLQLEARRVVVGCAVPGSRSRRGLGAQVWARANAQARVEVCRTSTRARRWVSPRRPRRARRTPRRTARDALLPRATSQRPSPAPARPHTSRRRTWRARVSAVAVTRATNWAAADSARGAGRALRYPYRSRRAMRHPWPRRGAERSSGRSSARAVAQSRPAHR